MTKILFSIFLFINIANALKIEVVEDNSGKESYMKDGRLVLNPIDATTIKPMDKNIIKPMDTKVLKPLKNKVLEPYNPILEKEKAIKKAKQDE